MVAYSPLVKYISGKIGASLPSHVEEADLISYGLGGLIASIERYDPRRDIKFETFANARIRGAIIDELRALDWVPRSVRSKAREIERAHQKLEHRLHRTPTDAELAAELEMSESEFRDALQQVSSTTLFALDELWGSGDQSGDSISLLDTIQDPDSPDPASLVDQGRCESASRRPWSACPSARSS